MRALFSHSPHLFTRKSTKYLQDREIKDFGEKMISDLSACEESLPNNRSGSSIRTADILGGDSTDWGDIAFVFTVLLLTFD